MYYHNRPLKYVEYGKIKPVWTEDCWFDLNYKWLGQFCGYAPQIWMSKGDISMTGHTNKMEKWNKDDILFGFDIIKGFPVSYEPWCFSLDAFLNLINIKELVKTQWFKDYKIEPARNLVSIEQLNERFEIFLQERWNTYFDEDPEENCSELYMESVATFKHYLFNEVDQVVVPSLNLKSAKKIICRTQKQKKALRKMGFIEDRIHVKKLKRSNF